MLDIKFIRDNRELVKEALKNRNLKLNIDELLKYYLLKTLFYVRV